MFLCCSFFFRQRLFECKDCGSNIGKSDELISPKPTSEEDNYNTNNDDAEMFTSEVHDPYARTTGA